MTEEVLGFWRGVATLLAMLGFLAVCAWAYSRRRHTTFDEAARRPLEEDPP